MNRLSHKEEKPSYSSFSIPTRLLEEIEKVVKIFGYWPTKTAFIREACLEKMEKYRNELESQKREEAEKAEIWNLA